MRKEVKARKKPVKPVTEKRLMNAATYYLGRFESTEHRLNEVLVRKVRRWSDGKVEETSTNLVEQTVRKCRDLGLVDDARYAEMRTRTLLARGKALGFIRRDLLARGVSLAAIDDVFGAIDAGRERTALADLARRRRLGIFRGPREIDRAPLDPRKWRDKELAALARSGHALGLAQAFLKLETHEDLDLWLEEG